MKEWISKYQKAIVGTGAVSVLLICFLQQKELTKLRKEVEVVKAEAETADGKTTNLPLVKAEADSLKSEDFIKGTIIGRYEITMEHLKEVNPKAAKQAEDWMSHNTE